MITTIPLGILGFLLGVTLAATITYRQKWASAVRAQQAELLTESAARLLAQWTVDTKITVCSVTGTWFSMTLAELAKSPVPYRAWNVPVSVEFHPASMDVAADQAKEHRA